MPTVKKKKYSDISAEKDIDDAIKKLSNIGDQDTFDNFGTLIASQLRSIPMEEALQLQMDISQLVNNRLLTICRSKNTTNSLSSSPSRPSTSHTLYHHTSEDESLDCYGREEDYIICETGDIVGRALRGILD